MSLALDSNVFIAFFEKEQDASFFDGALAILRIVERGELEVIYSSLVLGEVMRMPGRASLAPISRFFDELGGIELPADHAICTKAAELRLTYPSLKLLDAIHLATAIIGKADKFVTADKRLIAIAKQEIDCAYLKEFAV